VKQAALNTLVAVEVGCWFYVGEIIGRASLIGYSV
jgi:F-type H+-transporting ATPase subunit g